MTDARGNGASGAGPLLEVEGLTKHFPGRGGLFAGAGPAIRAVEDVSFTIGRGEVVGLVGESGSGKSTVGRCILRLIEPTAGRIRFEGEDVRDASGGALRAFRRRMQIVFQDPYGSLDPRKRVEDLVGEVLDIHRLARGAARRVRVVELLEQVGLSAEHLDRYPHQFSGGQRQRLGIARALAVGPAFIVADEPVSALDVSVQAQIINLLAELQERLGLAMLFISHDLSVVEHLSDRVIVLYLGRIMEVAPVPDPDASRQRIILTGDLPSPAAPPSGCVFRTRCPHAVEACAGTVPALTDVGPGHSAACIRLDELAASAAPVRGGPS